MDPTQPNLRDGGRSLRASIALLVVAVALPLAAYNAWHVLQDAREADAAERQRVAQVAGSVAAEAGRFVDDTRGLLERIAMRPGLRRMDASSCDPLFADFGATFPAYANLVLIDRDGRGLCASNGLVSEGNAYSHRGYFQAVVRGEPFHVDVPWVGRASKRWIVVLAVPVRGEEGAFGALAIAIDLASVSLATRIAASLPAGSTLELVNRAGQIIVHSSGPALIGAPAPAAALEAALRGERGPVDETSDGSAYRTAFAPVDNAPWFSVARVPSAPVIARDALLAKLGALALLLLATGAVALVATQRMLRPVGRMSRFAAAVMSGRAAGEAPRRGPREIAVIAAAFNRLLEPRAQGDCALPTNEARYHALFETSSDPIIGIDPQNRILFVNAAIERLTGWRPEELVGEDLSVLQPPDPREAHWESVRRFASEPGAGMRNRSIELRCLHRDGHEIPIEITLSSTRIDGAAVCVGFLRDIAERHAALAGLRESERRFRVMADSSPVLIWTADAVVREYYFNARWLEFTGQSEEEAREAGWHGGVHPDDAPAMQDVIDRANLRHEGCTLEYRRARRDGSYRWVLDTSAPRFDETGRFLGFVGTAVDIHDRVIAESRIRRLTTLYSALSQANEAIVRSADLSTLLKTVCDIVVRQTGIATAMVSLLDATGARMDDVAYSGAFASDFSRAPLDIAEAPRGQESPGSLVVRTNRRHVSADRHRDASVRPIVPVDARSRLRSSAVYPLQRQGRAVGVFAVYADEPAFFDEELTDLLDLLATNLSYALEAFAAREHRDLAEHELKRLNATLEERVAERTRSLEAANHELEAFSYSVSHDLRAPLRGIAGFTALLHDGYVQGMDETARSYLERVRGSAARMGRLIDDLLDLSRISRQPIGRADIDVSALAAEVVAELREGDPSRSVVVTIPPGLSAHADPGLTRIVLANLLGNAWKFTSGTPDARVVVASGGINGVGGFTISDNGAGFDAVYADRLFAPFQRLHGEHEFPGTGIGLAIVQRIVQRHGGALHVVATPGGGAAFTFTLGPA